MHTNESSARLGPWARSAWLAPLVLALFGCGGGGSSDPANDAAAAGAPGTAVAENLRGQWETILTYVPPFYAGPLDGTPDGDGSMGITFYFSADGHYQHFWTLSLAYFNGNCFRTAHWEEAGTTSGTGPDYTFHPGKATYVVTDTCGQSKYLDPAPVTAASHTLRVGQDNTGWPLLGVSFPTGELVLEKCKHCG